MRPIEIQPMRLTRATEKVVAAQPAKPLPKVVNGEKDVEISLNDIQQAGTPPVDAERVSQIRDAVEEGSYPLVPARIADAMIAASLLLRKAE
jgi:negative regulator of flagellin synthesis FlgM